MESVVQLITSRISDAGHPLMTTGEFLTCDFMEFSLGLMLEEYPGLKSSIRFERELAHVSKAKKNSKLLPVRLPWIQLCLYEYMQSFEYITVPRVSFCPPYSSGLIP